LAVDRNTSFRQTDWLQPVNADQAIGVAPTGAGLEAAGRGKGAEGVRMADEKEVPGL